VKITPTPWTAALAGSVAALAWPALWTRFGGPGSQGGMELIAGTLLIVALPAHALVVGFGRPASGARALDTALFKRIGAWLAAALATTALLAAT